MITELNDERTAICLDMFRKLRAELERCEAIISGEEYNNPALNELIKELEG